MTRRQFASGWLRNRSAPVTLQDLGLRAAPSGEKIPGPAALSSARESSVPRTGPSGARHAPALGADSNGQPGPRLLPVYVNAYPGDWQDGLAAQLASAAWYVLGDELREQLGVATLDDLRRQLLPAPVGGVDADASLIRRLRNEHGLTTLFIFDQFDDYQLTHRARFLRDGRWISPATLEGENALWRVVAVELAARNLHCLVIIRRELFVGVNAVRFEQAETRSLKRVQPAFVTALLEQLVGADGEGAVIAHPEAGWDALKERLIGDLTVQGWVLPIQARSVFKGLIKLPYLSTGAYERRGGIDGLEARYIEDAVRAAVSAAGGSEGQALKLLLHLVDETDPDLPKARARRQCELGAASESRGLTRLLGVLRQEGVIRRQVGIGDGAAPEHQRPDAREPAWTLYHDYLARPILTAHRRADRWQRLLVDRLRAFNRAADWRGRWRALLSPLEQLRLIWPTLRGRVRWAGFRLW